MEALLPLLEWLIAVLLLSGAALYLHARAGQRARMRQRLQAEIKRQGEHVVTARPGLRDASSGFKRLLRRLGASFPLLNQTQRIEASGKLVAAGYRSNQALFILGGTILLSSLVTVGLVAFYGYHTLNEGGPMYWLLAIVGGIFIGSLLPRLVLDLLVKRRQEAIRLALPDALDLLVITTNAGLAWGILIIWTMSWNRLSKPACALKPLTPRTPKPNLAWRALPFACGILPAPSKSLIIFWPRSLPILLPWLAWVWSMI